MYVNIACAVVRISAIVCSSRVHFVQCVCVHVCVCDIALRAVVCSSRVQCVIGQFFGFVLAPISRPNDTEKGLSNEANLVLRMCICVCMCVRTGVHACILIVKECRRLPEF